jgi:hypothetical protein
MKVKLITGVLTGINILLAVWLFRIPLGILAALVFGILGFGSKKIIALAFGKKYESDNRLDLVSLLLQIVFFILMSLMLIVMIAFI